MPKSTLFERLIFVAFCGLALGAAACAGEADVPNKSPATDTKLPSTIEQSSKTMTKTAVSDATVEATPSVSAEPKTAEPKTAELKTAEPSFGELLGKGRSLVKERAYGEAIEQFKLALDASPKSARVRIDMARAFIKLGQARSARSHAVKAVELKPKSSYAWNTLGRVELLEQKYEAAITSFERATVENPKNMFAWNNLGLTYIKARKFDEAVVALVKATALTKPKAYMWNNLGTAYERLNNFDEARAAYIKAAAMKSWAAKRSLARLVKADNDSPDESDEAPNS